MGAAQTAEQSGDTFGRALPCRMLMWQCTSGRLVIRLNGDPTGFYIAFSPCRHNSLLCHLIVLSLLVYFFIFAHDFSVILVLLCIFLSILGTFLVLFILFSVLLSVRILNLLGNMFEIKCTYLSYLLLLD
jgi:hypothetical protein